MTHILCWFGHKWSYITTMKRFCVRCDRHEALTFYSDRTQSWDRV